MSLVLDTWILKSYATTWLDLTEPFQTLSPFHSLSFLFLDMALCQVLHRLCCHEVCHLYWHSITPAGPAIKFCTWVTRGHSLSFWLAALGLCCSIVWIKTESLCQVTWAARLCHIPDFSSKRNIHPLNLFHTGRVLNNADFDIIEILFLYLRLFSICHLVIWPVELCCQDLMKLYYYY